MVSAGLAGLGVRGAAASLGAAAGRGAGTGRSEREARAGRKRCRRHAAVPGGNGCYGGALLAALERVHVSP